MTKSPLAYARGWLCSYMSTHVPPDAEKSAPIRTCVGCGAKRVQSEMLRIAARNGGAACLDETQRGEGRGAYLCREKKCAEAAWKRRAIERSLKLKSGLPDDVKEQITRAIDVA